MSIRDLVRRIKQSAVHIHRFGFSPSSTLVAPGDHPDGPAIFFWQSDVSGEPGEHPYAGMTGVIKPPKGAVGFVFKTEEHRDKVHAALMGG